MGNVKTVAIGLVNGAMSFLKVFADLCQMVIRFILAISITVPVLTFWIMLAGVSQSPATVLNFEQFLEILKSVVKLSFQLTVISLFLYSGFCLVFGAKNRLIPNRLRNA
ncbi:hypothetical protein ACKWMY_24795 [Serratia sp. J2]|uniref:hypothetical protein n=1 Tax=Serratia sp. J2 TaxID=3386551 RepID=UPI0039172494